MSSSSSSPSLATNATRYAHPSTIETEHSNPELIYLRILFGSDLVSTKFLMYSVFCCQKKCSRFFSCKKVIRCTCPVCSAYGDGGQAAKAKDGVKTEWTMYEYESLDSEAEFEALRSGNASKVSSSLSASPFHLDVVSVCVSARDIITNIGLILFLYTDGRSGLVHDPEEEALPGGW
jgi:hypothetical protein